MDKELRESIDKIYKKSLIIDFESDCWEEIEILIDLAEAYLKVEGFPEEQPEVTVVQGCEYDVLKNIGYNTCLKTCKLAHLKIVRNP